MATKRAASFKRSNDQTIERSARSIAARRDLYPDAVERHIVAMGGGQWPDDPIFRFIFELTGAARPKILSLPTATGDTSEHRRLLQIVLGAHLGAVGAHAVRAQGAGSALARAHPGRRARGGRQHAEHAGGLACARSRRDPSGSLGCRRRARRRQRGRQLLVRGVDHRLVSHRAVRPARRRARVREGELLPALRLRALAASVVPPARRRGCAAARHRVR